MSIATGLSMHVINVGTGLTIWNETEGLRGVLLRDKQRLDVVEMNFGAVLAQVHRWEHPNLQPSSDVGFRL